MLLWEVVNERPNCFAVVRTSAGCDSACACEKGGAPWWAQGAEAAGLFCESPSGVQRGAFGMCQAFKRLGNLRRPRMM